MAFSQIPTQSGFVCIEFLRPMQLKTASLLLISQSQPEQIVSRGGIFCIWMRDGMASRGTIGLSFVFSALRFRDDASGFTR